MPKFVPNVLPAYDNSKDIKPQIEQFRIWCTKQPGLSKDDKMAKMKAHFGHDGMCKLWGVLKTQVKHAKPEVQAQWEQLNATKGDRTIPKGTIKAHVLVDVVDKVEDWQENFVAQMKEIVSFKKKSAKGEWLTKGELVAQKGYDEAMADIRKGKFESREDAWGDTQYRRVHESDETGVEQRDSVNLQSKGRGKGQAVIDALEGFDIATAFDALVPRPKAMMKRPAAAIEGQDMIIGIL